MTQESRIEVAQLAIWTKKFANPLFRIQMTSLQKITASEQGQLILSIYKPGDDRSSAMLSIKKGDSGLSLTHTKPKALKQPNSFVQIARKYLQGRKFIACYATISPICVILECSPVPQSFEDADTLNAGPDCLILDLDYKPPRLILAKKYTKLPERYHEQYKDKFIQNESFFESWCEWSEENTKTKRRSAFDFPMVAYCPIPIQAENFTTDLSKQINQIQTNSTEQVLQQNENFLTEQSHTMTLTKALEFLPTHIRRAARTRLQFFERRLQRQKADFPQEKEIERLKKISLGLRSHLYLWPHLSLSWCVPPQFIEEYGLAPIYTIKKSEKPSDILESIHNEMSILERRKQELTMRIAESEKSLSNFIQLIISGSQELQIKVHQLCQERCFVVQDKNKNEKQALLYALSHNELVQLACLAKTLDLALLESEQTRRIQKEKEKRLPYRSYFASTGEFIRVARSAADGDSMIKLMPSNHVWLHVLTGEGSHVWLEKAKGTKSSSPQALREASVLAVHHSKHARSQSADVQISNRADIEKKKDLPPGKVLVRRCATLFIKYDQQELQTIFNLNRDL